MKYDVIVMDPPYSFSDKLQMSDVARGASSNYPTMTISEIKELPVKGICNREGAVLCLWVPSSLLQEGLDIMRAYGFRHKQTYIWVKTRKLDNIKKEIFTSALDLAEDIRNKVPKRKALANFTLNLGSSLGFGMGRLFRQCHEVCLIGVSGKKLYKRLQNKSQRSVSFAQNLKHSAKPEHLQNSLELMFKDCNMIEIFSRRQRKGWVCLGNESPMTYGEDVRVSLDKLKKVSEKEMLSINNLLSFYDEGKRKDLFEMWNKLS